MGLPQNDNKNNKLSKNIYQSSASTTEAQANDYYLIASSYHEASHTVMGLYNLILINDVSIVRGQGGNTNYVTYEAKEFNDVELQRVVFLTELQLIYAGLIGEKLYYQDICGSIRFPQHLRVGSSADMKMAYAIIRDNKLSLPGAETSKLKNDLIKYVETFLTENWEAIKIIAHSLYKKKKLSFDELKYLLTRNSINKELWKDKFKKINFIHTRKKDLLEAEIKKLLTF
jgi:hypothetical protein